MSTKAKMTLGVTTLCTIAVVWGVHYQQMSEKEVTNASTPIQLDLVLFWRRMNPS